MPNTYLKLMAQSSRDPARVMAGSGLSVEDVLLRDAPITVEQQLICARNAAAMTRRPDWHFEWAEAIGEHFHGPLTSALFSTPTLGDGLNAYVKYLPSRIPYLVWRERVVNDVCRIEVESMMPLGELGPILIEIPLLALLAYVRTLRGGRVQGLCMALKHSPRVASERYSKRFRADFSFGARSNALILPKIWCQQAHAGHDAVLWRASLRRCALSEREGYQGPVADTLRQLLLRSFDSGDFSRTPPTVTQAARRLHLSVRSLHRRLAEAGLSYQQLVDEARRERAAELLVEPQRKLGDIAAALGYRDPANFSRAFRRWYGVPPSAAR
jgi:AraC-like DNA-binding protein